MFTDTVKCLKVFRLNLKIVYDNELRTCELLQELATPHCFRSSLVIILELILHQIYWFELNWIGLLVNDVIKLQMNIEMQVLQLPN